MSLAVARGPRTQLSGARSKGRALSIASVRSTGRALSILGALSAAACKEDAPKAAPEPPPSAAPSATAPPEPEKPWFVGAWTGKAKTTQAPPDVPPTKGGIQEWKADERTEGVGDVDLSLQIGEDGTVGGTITGALGTLTANGTAHENEVRARLAPGAPADEATFSGLLVLEKKGDSLGGTLVASSSDSVNARRADVTLAKKK